MLDKDVFWFYVVQDALYLRNFACRLTILGVKAPEDDWLIMICEHAETAIVIEWALHESFFREWGLMDEQRKNLFGAKAPPTGNVALFSGSDFNCEPM